VDKIYPQLWSVNMQLSEGVEWAVHSCTMLAALPAGATLTTSQLAEFFGVPRAYLAKALQALSNAGLVDATPGRTGGYRLARTAEKITLRDVVSAIEGSRPCFRCQEIRQRGPSGQPRHCYTRACGIARAMLAAEKVWLAELGKTTLAALIEEARHEVSREQKAATARWLEQNA
jgi:Rrf2 family protein